MTKSEIQWERNFDEERASNIARRFAIEDLALKYRTSLKTAEKLLATGMIVERHTDSKSPKSPDTIEIDDSPNQTKLEPQDEMEVDVERLETDHELFSGDKYRKQDDDYFQTTKSPLFELHRSQFSPRPRQAFVFSTKSTSPVALFDRHCYSSPRFSSQTWPYSVTYPHFARETRFTRSYPLLYSMAGSKSLTRHIPVEVLRNYYREGQPVEGKSQEEILHERTEEAVPQLQKPQTYTFPTDRFRRIAPPRKFLPSEERPHAVAPPEERPRVFMPSQERPRVFLPPEERAMLRTFEEENARWSKISEEKSKAFSLDGVKLERLYEKRPRSYTPPGLKEDLKESMLKPRRHSDDTVSNLNRPSVLVMQRSLSNPVTPCQEHGRENYEQCAWNEENLLTDSDSSATPPLAQEGSSSSSDSSKGKISGNK